MSARGWFTVVLVCTAVLLASCGSGSSVTTPTSTVVVKSLGTVDGVVFSTGTAWTNAVGPGIGDIDCHGEGVSLRILYCFLLQEIPPDAVIEQAVLHVYQEAVPFGNPYETHGDLIVDHVTLEAGLSGEDFDGGTLTANVGVLSSDPVTGWKTVDVTAAVQADQLAGRSHTDVRIRWSQLDSDADDECDCVCLNDGEDTLGTGHVPTLEIVYALPGG